MIKKCFFIAKLPIRERSCGRKKAKGSLDVVVQESLGGYRYDRAKE